MTIVGPLLAVGRTSEVFAFGTDSVVKVPRPDVPRDWPEIEAASTTAVHALGLPTPEVGGLIEVNGVQAIVFERIVGPSMWQLIIDQPRDAAALGRDLGEIHQEILASGLPAGLPGAVDRMVTKIDTVEQLTEAERSEGTDLVESLPRGAALLHGDLHPGNVLMSGAGPVVIDWFDAAIGHPVSDAVRSSLLLRPSDRPHDRPHLPGASSEVLRSAHNAYGAKMQPMLADDEAVKQWEAVVALSRLAEQAQRDSDALLQLWRNRSRKEPSELSRLLLDSASGH